METVEQIYTKLNSIYEEPNTNRQGGKPTEVKQKF